MSQSQEELDKAAAKAADKKAIDEDNARKTDLNEGADADVDDGRSQVPVKVDPFEGRKTIFKRNRNHREERIAREAEEHPDVAHSRQVMEEEAGQGSSRNELDRGSHVDTNAPGRFDNQDRRTQLERLREEAGGDGDDASRLNEGQTASHQDGASANARVKVKVLGQEFEVPQSDVDEAGGITAYQKDRAASMRLQDAARREADLKAEREALRKEREQFQQERESSGRNAPAKAPGAPAGAAPIQKDGAGEGEDVQAKAEAIANDLYSGNPKRARAAIAQIMQAQTAPVAQIDPAEVARQAAELLKQQDQQRDNGKSAPAQPVDAGMKVELQELNDMMSSEYRDLLEDPDMKAKALAKFNELRADPANKYRRLVDMGREAAKLTQKAGKHPRQDVVERKRSLPPTPQGHTAHRPSAPAPVSGSAHIERMRKSRGLPT